MELRITEQFAGIPGIALGGYLGGLVARELVGPVEVTFRSPPHVGRSLNVAVDDKTLTVHSDGTLVAQAATVRLDVEIPPAIDVRAAEIASARSPMHSWHPFANCFCCGPDRGDDGLRILPGPVEGREMMAAVWTPNLRFADEDGIIPPEIVWASLDCPAIFALCLRVHRGAPDKVMSGRIAVDHRHPVRAGEPHIVVAWPLGGDGRVRMSGAALLTADGTPVAVSRQTCIVTSQGVPLGSWGLKVDAGAC